MRHIPWQEKLLPEPNSGCWLYDGTWANGYGAIRDKDRKTVRVHRLAWEQANGPIPEGLSVLHRCDVPACCNPEHLFLGTQAANNLDMKLKGRLKGASWVLANKTTCKYGHSFTAENTYITKSGYRNCRECHRRTARLRYITHDGRGEAMSRRAADRAAYNLKARLRRAAKKGVAVE
jgi:hypothetical protein